MPKLPDPRIPAWADMLEVEVADKKDGSHRLMRYCHICKVHGVTTPMSVGLIRQILTEKPAPVEYNDAAIVGRLNKVKLDQEGSGNNGRTKSASPIETKNEYKPFPVEYLPDGLAEFVKRYSDSMDCDPSYIALPLMSAAAAAIGNTIWYEGEAGERFPSSIWSLIIGHSGTNKSGGYRIAEQIFKRRTACKISEFADIEEAAEEEFQRYELAMKKWKGAGGKGDMPKKPTPPTLDQCLTSDPTVESLITLLAENPQGLLVARNELNGWLQSFGQYKGGQGDTDQAHYLELFDGDSVTVHRCSRGTKPNHVGSALVSITGTIQPGVLEAAFTTQNRESGFAARFLLAHPPRRQETYRRVKVGDYVFNELAELFDQLFAIEQHPDHSTGRRRVARLDDDSKVIFEEHFNRHHEKQFGLDNEMSAIWSKLLQYSSRFALVFHVINQVSCDADPTADIPAGTLLDAITLAEWFKGESLRIYGVIDEDGFVAKMREQADWINRIHGGAVTVRQYLTGHRRIKTADEAEAELKQLSAGGFGTWDTTDRKKVVFRTH